MESKKIKLEINIEIGGEYEDLHISDTYGHSCNYDCDEGITNQVITESVKDFLKYYYNIN